MNDLHTNKLKIYRRRHGGMIVKASLLVLVLGLATWGIWTWMAVPLLALPPLNYWQMTGIVALIGLIRLVFSGAVRHRFQIRPGRTAAACALSVCGCSTDSRKG